MMMLVWLLATLSSDVQPETSAAHVAAATQPSEDAGPSTQAATNGSAAPSSAASSVADSTARPDEPGASADATESVKTESVNTEFVNAESLNSDSLNAESARAVDAASTPTSPDDAAPETAPHALRKSERPLRRERFVPIRLSLGPADFGQLPELEGTSRLLVTQKFGALIATQDLFGALALETQLRGTATLHHRVWVDLVIPLVVYQQVINATLTASKLSFGNVSASGHFLLHENQRERVTVFARALLPTSTEYRLAQRTGFEIGIAAGVAPRPWLTVMTGLQAPTVFTVLGGRVQGKLMPTLSLDAAFHVCSGFHAVIGSELRLAISTLTTFEHFAPKVALRFYPVAGFLIELKGMYVVAGAERQTINAGLSAGFIF